MPQGESYMSLLSVTLVLLFIMDPMGNIASFEARLKRLSSGRRSFLILREMGFALALMLFFLVIGEHLKSLLDLSDSAVHISTGLVLFLIAIGVLFPGPRSIRQNPGVSEERPFLVPLAIPLIAGPGLLATVMLYAQQEETGWLMLVAVLLAWTIALAVLLLGERINQVMGRNGLVAAEKLIAMVLVMLAIQRFLEGVSLFIQEL